MFGIFKRVAKLEEKIEELQKLVYGLEKTKTKMNLLTQSLIIEIEHRRNMEEQKTAPKKKRGRPRKIVS